MSEKCTKRLQTACGILTAVLVLFAGACFIASCLHICQSGARPFSAEAVAAHYRAIRIPVIACIVSIAVSGILCIVFPTEAGRTKAIREEADILAALKRKAGILTDEALAQAATREQIRRRALTACAYTLFCASSISLILFFFESSRFTIENMSRDIRQGLVRFVAAGLTCFIAYIAHWYLTKRSLAREIAIYKTAIAEGNCDGIPLTAEAAHRHKHTLLIARCAVAVIALVFIVLGIFNGGMRDVLGKAIAICTECIGLG